MGYQLPTCPVLGYKDRIWEVNVSKAKVSHKSEMAGPFYMGDNNQTLYFLLTNIKDLFTIKINLKHKLIYKFMKFI